jgi:hypothetical protein
MLHQVYLRKGTVIVPTTGRVEDRGPYRDIEPVGVAPVSDAEAIRSALQAAIARGNPPTLRYPRGAYAQPAVVKHAGVKSWGPSRAKHCPLGISRKRTETIKSSVIANIRPAGSRTRSRRSNFRVVRAWIERMIAILQDAARQQSS